MSFLATCIEAQDEFVPQYSTGEIDLVDLKYIGPDVKVGGQANFLHGIENLQKLVPGTILDGDGVRVAIWDGGLVQTNHQDLTPRVLVKDPQQLSLYLDNHATHVAGTIGGTGKGRPSARGVAPGTKLWSFDFQNDIAEMEGVAKSGVVVSVSNHSYGFNTGWSGICAASPTKVGGKERLVWVWSGMPNENEDPKFGQYGASAVGFDSLAQRQPNWTMVVAAGNTRGPLLDPHNAAQTIDSMPEFKDIAGKYDLAFAGAHRLWGCTGKTSNKPHRSNRHDSNGFDSIPYGPAAAKNVITVGAMKDPPLDEIMDSSSGKFLPLNRKHVVTTNFSSWGPVDDGRIKPDIVASGHAVLAPAIPPRCEKKNCKPGEAKNAGDNANYIQMSGTSMAAPVVSGTVAILNELSMEVRGRRLRSDEARAMLIHTALSPAKVEGPSYKVGWGALQADLAGRLLTDVENGDSVTMVEISSEKTKEIVMIREGLRLPRITLVWLDEAGISQNGLNERNPTLVNDIDMTLTTENGDVIHPWKLDPGDPSAPAKRGNNQCDNVERIDVPRDMLDNGDTCVLRITGKKWKNAKKVDVALAVWGFSQSKKPVAK